MLTGVFAADSRYRDDAETLADLTTAFYRGLAIDLVSAPDRLRYRPTFDCFINLLQGSRGSVATRGTTLGRRSRPRA